MLKGAWYCLKQAEPKNSRERQQGRDGDQCDQREQESADAAADGRLSNAVMVQNWA